MTEQSALREQLTTALRPWLLGADEADVEAAVGAVLAEILPHGKLLGDLARDSEATLHRVLHVIDNLAAEPHPTHGHLCPDDVREAVRAALTPPEPAAGPSVAECAANDRRWPIEKHGE